MVATFEDENSDELFWNWVVEVMGAPSDDLPFQLQE